MVQPPENQGMGAVEQLPPDQKDFLDLLSDACARLHRGNSLLAGNFDNRLPFLPWKAKERFMVAITSRPASAAAVTPVDLDAIDGRLQISNSDCVGALTASVFSTVTGVDISEALYRQYLKTATTHGFGKVTEDQEVQVYPYILNALQLPAFERKYLKNTTVARKSNESLAHLSELVKRTRQRKGGYKLFVLLPISSQSFIDKGHFVALQQIGPDTVMVFDPKLGQVEMSHQDLENRWEHSGNSAILVFTKPMK